MYIYLKIKSRIHPEYNRLRCDTLDISLIEVRYRIISKTQGHAISRLVTGDRY